MSVSHHAVGQPAMSQRSDVSSLSSPGQAEKREKLLAIYDELDDAGKTELLRLAEQLTNPR